MASTRVEFALTAKTTSFFNPDDNIEPMYVVKILLQRKYQTLVRITGGPQDLPVDESPIARDSSLFEIPFQVVAQPEACLAFLAHMISSFDVLSASVSDYLASKIADFADDLVKRGCYGFYVLAHVGVVEEIVDEVVLGSEDDDIVDVSSGTACASKITLEE